MIAGTNKLGLEYPEQIEGVGLLLSSVDLGSPLDKAGVIGGDLAITFDGIDLTVAPTLKTYCDILSTKTSAGQVLIEVFRLQDLNIYSGVLNSGTKISTSDNFESAFQQHNIFRHFSKHLEILKQLQRLLLQQRLLLLWLLLLQQLRLLLLLCLLLLQQLQRRLLLA